ncbi:MAG: sugar phosphate isomerase/epimerase family protein [Phycisphaerae bacterium]|nr:sugar phosphate isomerase/epimerase family protein [Tepidisphaeraceae bacterium]
MITRRSVLAASAALLAARPTFAAPPQLSIKKAKIVGKITEALLKPLQQTGFDGVETTHVCDEPEAAVGKAVAERLNMRVHSVLRGWMDFNSPDPKQVESSLEATRKALRAAKAYGADAILLVPCRVSKIVMPEPWDFKIEFDEKTGHVTRVADGDNEKYAEYITAQNRATDTSRAAVEKLIPLAQELGVVIGLENVWNNLWVDPRLYRHFVASFKSPWAKAYFDIGNVVKYSMPDMWIAELGAGQICKLHVKDFKLNPDNHNGKFVHPGDGSIDWPAVRAALANAKYEGWATIEDGGLALEEFSKRFDTLINGKA